MPMIFFWLLAATLSASASESLSGPNTLVAITRSNCS